jgi:hypothetical protein
MVEEDLTGVDEKTHLGDVGELDRTKNPLNVIGATN